MESQVFDGRILSQISAVEAGLHEVGDPDESGIDAWYDRRNVRHALQCLSPREERVLRLRFGFDGEGQTLAQAAEQFGVGPECIRQIEAKALRKLRRPSRSRKLGYRIASAPTPWSPPVQRPAPPVPVFTPPGPKQGPPAPSYTININGPQRVTVIEWADDVPMEGPGPFGKFRFNGSEWWGPRRAFTMVARKT